MDTTEIYIKMCQQAKEIQEHVNFTSGDFVYCIKNGKTVVLYFNAGNGSPPWYYTDIETSIFLPRQDQLQEMIGGSWMDILGDFNEWSKGVPRDKQPMSKSMEQIWLYFVMKEKYNKYWNGEDWVSA